MKIAEQARRVGLDEESFAALTADEKAEVLAEVLERTQRKSPRPQTSAVVFGIAFRFVLAVVFMVVMWRLSVLAYDQGWWPVGAILRIMVWLTGIGTVFFLFALLLNIRRPISRS